MRGLRPVELEHQLRATRQAAPPGLTGPRGLLDEEMEGNQTSFSLARKSGADSQ